VISTRLPRRLKARSWLRCSTCLEQEDSGGHRYVRLSTLTGQRNGGQLSQRSRVRPAQPMAFGASAPGQRPRGRSIEVPGGAWSAQDDPNAVSLISSIARAR